MKQAILVSEPKHFRKGLWATAQSCPHPWTAARDKDAPRASEGSAIGVLNGAREMKRKIVIIGYDSGKQQKDAIRSGTMAGAITQNPVGIGYKTVEAAVKALKGEKLPKVIDTGFYWYDKSAIDDPKIAAVLCD